MKYTTYRALINKAMFTAQRQNNNALRFNRRLNNGKLFENAYLQYLKENNENMTFTLSKGQNKEFDIKGTYNNKNVYIEVKSEIKSNDTGNIFIKAYQLNPTTNQYEKASLLTGHDNIHWVGFFLHGDEWYKYTTTKGELRRLCADYKEITINQQYNNKTTQKGYLIPIHAIKYIPIEETF